MAKWRVVWWWGRSGVGGVAAHFFHCYYYFIITHCSLRANVSPQYPPPNPAAFQVVSFRGGQQPPPPPAGVALPTINPPCI